MVLKANTPDVEFAEQMLKLRRANNYDKPQLPNAPHCTGCGDKITLGTLCKPCQELQNIGRLT